MQFSVTTKRRLDAFTQHGKDLPSLSQMSKSSKGNDGGKSASQKHPKLIPIEEGEGREGGGNGSGNK